MTQRRDPQRRHVLALNHLQDYINIVVVVKIGLGWSVPIRKDSAGDTGAHRGVVKFYGARAKMMTVGSLVYNLGWS